MVASNHMFSRICFNSCTDNFRCRPAETRLLELRVRIPPGAWMTISCERCAISGRGRVRIPPGAWMTISCERCVISGRGLCTGLKPRPEDSHQVCVCVCVCVWCVCVCVCMSLSVNRCKNNLLHLQWEGTAVGQWLRYCATNRKVAGWFPDGVIGIFHLYNPSDRIMALESTQFLTEMSTRSISWG